MAASATSRPKATGWVVGTTLLAVLMIFGAWTLGISPVLDEAAEARSTAQDVRDANDALQVKIDRLSRQFQQIGTYRADLAAMRVQIPTTAEMDAYWNEVATIAAANGVTVMSHSADPAVIVGPPAATPETTPPTDDEAAVNGGASGDATSPPTAPESEVESGAGTTPDGGAEPAPAAAPASAALLQSLVAIPVSVTVLGPYPSVVAFIGAMQQGTQRAFLATELRGIAQDEAEASAGRPATSPGDIELNLRGYVYVLMDPYVIPGPDGKVPEEPAPPQLPGETPGKNPLIPVGAAG